MRYYNFSQHLQDELGHYNNMPVFESMGLGHSNKTMQENLRETDIAVKKRPTNIKKVKSRAGFKGARTKRKNKEYAARFFKSESPMNKRMTNLMQEYYSP